MLRKPRISTNLFLCLFFTLAATQIKAQEIVYAGVNTDTMSFEGITQEGNVLHMNFDIPFPGMVEFFLYDESGELVWRKQTAMESGKGRISLRATAFKKDVAYSYRFHYKRSDFTGEIPPVLAMR